MESLFTALAAIVVGILQSFSPGLSYIAPVFAGIERPQAHVLFVGDMMFDRTVRTVVDAKGGDFIFSCIEPTLSNADMAVGNLEGPITATTSRSVGTAPGDDLNYLFTFPLSTAELLRAHHFRFVNLGNNHILNFGWEGVRSTEETLTGANVGYFGDPLYQTAGATEVHGVKLAFIGYNEFAPRGSGDSSTTIAQIQAEKARGALPIVYAHWGIEYATTSPQYVRDLAHSFIDAGAELVVGSHPHVVEEHEVYKGKYIYYSLGNFIFDQYWSDDVRRGLMLDVVFTRTGVLSLQELPVELGHDRRTCLVE